MTATASVLKQDPNTEKIQKNAYLLWLTYNLQNVGVIPLIKRQNSYASVLMRAYAHGGRAL